MPILAAEPELFPADLFEDARSADEGRAWWVCHTKPRQEKSLARDLLCARTPFYLPMISRRLQMRNRQMTSHIPLFPSYIFLHASREERMTALGTARVVHSLPVADQEALWRDLRQIHRLIRSGAPITPEDRLTPGTTVEITCGPLTGLRGKIVESASCRRFIVEVDFIQRGASVSLEGDSLLPVRGE